MSTQPLNHSINSSPSEWDLDEPGPERLPAVAAELLPLAEEVAAACQRSQRFEGEDPPPDELLATPLAELALVQRLQQAVAQQPDQLAAFEAHCDWTLFDWVSDRIFAAAEHGQVDQALRLFDDWNKLTADQTADLIGTRERLLLCGGRHQEAKAAVQARLIAEPEDLDALESAAFIYQKCGELDTAEKYARSYLAVAAQSGDATDEICALQTLADVLHERGDHEAASALEQKAAALPMGELDPID